MSSFWWPILAQQVFVRQEGRELWGLCGRNAFWALVSVRNSTILTSVYSRQHIRLILFTRFLPIHKNGLIQYTPHIISSRLSSRPTQKRNKSPLFSSSTPTRRLTHTVSILPPNNQQTILTSHTHTISHTRPDHTTYTNTYQHIPTHTNTYQHIKYILFTVNTDSFSHITPVYFHAHWLLICSQPMHKRKPRENQERTISALHCTHFWHQPNVSLTLNTNSNPQCNSNHKLNVQHCK